MNLLDFPAIAKCPQCGSRECPPLSCRHTGVKHEEWAKRPQCAYTRGKRCDPSCNRRGNCLETA